MYIGKLEDENVEKQAQLEVFLKFEEEFEDLRAKYEAQSSQFKTIKIEKINLEDELGDLRREKETRDLRIKALERRIENEQTGRERLEEKQEQDAFQEQEMRERIRVLEKQLIEQNGEM